jgi:hypothetical protein
MSITVRRFTMDDLNRIHEGSDKRLATVFMNKRTFSQHDIKYYPYGLRHEYLCTWLDPEEPRDMPDMEVTIYATDKDTLKWFIEQEYKKLPDIVHEVTTKLAEISIA